MKTARAIVALPVLIAVVVTPVMARMIPCACHAATAQSHSCCQSKPAATLQWGGYGGSFADPDGYVWSIGYSAQGKDQPYAE